MSADEAWLLKDFRRFQFGVIEMENVLTTSPIRCAKVCLDKPINLIAGRNGSKNLGSIDSFDRAHK